MSTDTTHNLYSYTDYRAYLEHHFQEKAKNFPAFSYRSFSLKAGFSSPNFVRMVVLGKRNLSVEGIDMLANYLNLKDKEKEYFKNLVLFNQSSSQEESFKYFEKLCLIKSFLEIKKIDYSCYRYFSNWYLPVIRELVLLDEFQEDAKWISEKLNKEISISEAKDAIDFLLENQFLKRDKNERLQQNNQTLSTDNDIKSMSLLKFHQEMIKKAYKSLNSTPFQFRDISSITVSIDYDKFIEFKNKLQKLREEFVVDLSQSHKKETVYQLNMQFFNLSQIPKSWKKKL